MDTRYGKVKWGKGQPRQRTSVSNWKQPRRWNKAPNCWNQVDCGRSRVFCASLSDWLDGEAPIEWLADLLELIHETPNLDWLLLTKRPENWATRIGQIADERDPNWKPSTRFPQISNVAKFWLTGQLVPQNVWLGVSVENQEQADKRIPILEQIPAKVRFLSVEPQLDHVSFRTPADLLNIHWVICGGESGQNKRPFVVDWGYSLRDQCKEAGVAFFMKQIDKVRPIPADLMVREFPL